ncbi:MULTISPECIES: imidazolonepropionase [unclassified Mucilaginibacter]|uniref:imidazolonepropionase n=1 Tax=unclassified Mucilaginibacter TaxID=2617802 RepID=UPI002AC8D1D4|nr:MULTISPECIES: imidazolonepropionase [unclassified Mucilaginibacter]MEB0262440.1 imidazolonepropionase [Mucilaginibacter sp. 10I4]MEB0279265.1 imidazolonepropionase [Mucilaginibacter sp. 10B2]MEB0300635.1 imidazolonepropionase [Mucilaginibacter sp. 5C4]WPX23223.1 imidazolonepropionase [Mucilaginibacter sp. 5C4]
MKKLIGPFIQIAPLTGLPLKGALKDEQLHIIPNGGVLVEGGLILAVGDFDKLRKTNPSVQIEEITSPQVLLPGFIDCHTHICFGGNRAKDYAMRIAGKTYLEIAKAGGGIWDTVTQTRAADEAALVQSLMQRANRHLADGVTTIEVKSGYGLSVEEELKQLRAIKNASAQTKARLIPTCLAAHMVPKDFNGSQAEYLAYVVNDLLPIIKQENLTNRVDIFIEQSAIDTKNALVYLNKANQLGFDITVHADQFTTSGSAVAVEVGAVSADHLEASGEKEIGLLAKSNTVAVTLPGASLGLGMPYAPARKLLDAGACFAIASDWNPGSAPMGDLLMQAAVMSASEKLSAAEVFAGLTFRAASALKIECGILGPGMAADMQAYPCADYREILYYQGKLKPNHVWVAGNSHV